MRSKKIKSAERHLIKIFFFILVFSFSSITNSSAITFPDKTLKVNDASYLISLWSIDSETFQRKNLFCSGVLIDTYHFLTAAHCLDNPDNFIAVAATMDFKNRGQTLVITDYKVHPRYDKKTFQNDIALARVYYPLDTNSRWNLDLKNFPLIPDNDKKLRNDMRLFGWGDGQNSKTVTSANSIKQNDFTKEAKNVFKDFNDKTMMGAGFYYKDEKIYGGACYGDSGGPLINFKDKKPYLVGITSYGSAEGCDVRKPTTYTRVAYYRSWITSAKKEMLKNWFDRGIVVQNSPEVFSLPNNSVEFLTSEKDNYGSSSWILLSKDADAGRADIESLMVQIYKNNFIGVNLYFTNPVDGCILRQKGSIKLQISKNSYQDVDGLISISPSYGCFKNENEVYAYNFKTPPNNFNGTCSVTIKPFTGGEKYPSLEIHQLALQFDRRCLGVIEKLWIRANVNIEDDKGESDVEPGVDMWIGPVNPK